ncbi:hypothetical protein BC835DRAFT_1277588 [Cytidiella melzeri]|nr:hypothetical protein BC835DRAFT_1277588 [Cytidiella melzeri]
MQFPFSFAFAVPGLVNPFSPTQPSSPAPGPTAAVEAMNGTGHVEVKTPSRLPRRPPPPTISQPQNSSKKRGWVPAFSEPSEPATVPASTSGYLDTPSKYRDISMTPSREEVEIQDVVADLPPPKRRKTLAGSIVSTALSAALIGTAVGLTVYRIWRGRDKQPEALPPPPYEQGEWVPPSPDITGDFDIVNHNSPRNRKQRHVAGRRTVPRQRKLPLRAQTTFSASCSVASTSTPSRPSIPPEFAFDSPSLPEPERELEDQMDWMGSQLAKLIEDGKRALSKEVVVMSERQEDAEDDGSGQWVDESNAPLPRSRSGSMRRHKRPRNVNVSSPPPSYISPQTTPRKNRFDITHSRSGSPRKSARGVSSESSRSHTGSYREDDAAWQTPELRESMERARRLLLQQRSHAA